MDEFGMGSTSETSAYGSVVNMKNRDRVVGGSSGGSIAALVSNQCMVSLGTDTGGSIRQPASYMGLVGIKPTYGAVSRYGLVAYASSFDTIGPVAKNVEDAARILDIIERYDVKDGTSVDRKKYDEKDGKAINDKSKIKLEEYLNKDIKGMRIAIPKEYMDDNLDKEIKDAIYNLKDKLQEVENNLYNPPKKVEFSIIGLMKDSKLFGELYYSTEIQDTLKKAEDIEFLCKNKVLRNPYGEPYDYLEVVQRDNHDVLYWRSCKETN
jgi:Asp-tRNA(Asn)/Glu-tRNA(Gln) amidotransferase A subunit family amidase